MEDISAERERGKHRDRVRGVEPVVQVAARALRRRETDAEQLLWSELRSRHCGGFKFRRQHAVGPYILDLFCAELQLVVEVDGEIHNNHDAQEHDALRTAHLERYGYHVLRFPNARVLTIWKSCSKK